MYAFDYHRPNSLADAAGLLAGSDDGKLLAGGHTLLPTMKLRLAAPKTIIDLGRIAELRGIEAKGNDLVIGAMETHDAVASSPVVNGALPQLSRLASHIGDQHVRHRGTIGGSLANNDPAADYPAAVLALNARIVTNKREIVADDFFKGLFATALGADEIITRIVFPRASKFAYAKFANPASRYALVGVGVAQTASGVRVAVTGASASGVYRESGMEAALARGWSPQSLAGLAGDASKMMSDIHADAPYRAHLVGVMARRAVAASA
jgi:aerobic carbon-monoxide dehydrogenase medium subunit